MMRINMNFLRSMNSLGSPLLRPLSNTLSGLFGRGIGSGLRSLSTESSSNKSHSLTSKEISTSKAQTEKTDLGNQENKSPAPTSSAAPSVGKMESCIRNFFGYDSRTYRLFYGSYQGKIDVNPSEQPKSDAALSLLVKETIDSSKSGSGSEKTESSQNSGNEKTGWKSFRNGILYPPLFTIVFLSALYFQMEKTYQSGYVPTKIPVEEGAVYQSDLPGPGTFAGDQDNIKKKKGLSSGGNSSTKSKKTSTSEEETPYEGINPTDVAKRRLAAIQMCVEKHMEVFSEKLEELEKGYRTMSLTSEQIQGKKAETTKIISELEREEKKFKAIYKNTNVYNADAMGGELSALKKLFVEFSTKKERFQALDKQGEFEQKLLNIKNIAEEVKERYNSSHYKKQENGSEIRKLLESFETEQKNILELRKTLPLLGDVEEARRNTVIADAASARDALRDAFFESELNNALETHEKAATEWQEAVESDQESMKQKVLEEKQKEIKKILSEIEAIPVLNATVSKSLSDTVERVKRVYDNTEKSMNPPKLSPENDPYEKGKQEGINMGRRQGFVLGGGGVAAVGLVAYFAKLYFFG